ncbi:MAG: amidohydrolase [Solobacterium sp.]|nr:amidohydrolase [Solobacterium sp.]
MINEKIQQRIRELAEQYRPAYEEVCHEIFLHPEEGLKEFFAADYITGRLQAAGFRITRPAGGLETAFIAEYGEGHPRLALLAEYDALPGYGPLKDQWGHACGHNWIAANTWGTAMIMKDLLDEGLVSGTICYVGCPAEETIGGKVNLAEAGCFDDMDAAVQIHIGSGSGAYVGGHALALNGIEVTYHGVSSHAAGAPERGVNALDAAYLTFDGVNALRQHVTPDVRMHGVIINGGLAPNVVPALAVSRWEVRAAERATVDELERKFLNIVQGACLMTGATSEWKYFENKFDNCVNIAELNELFGQGFAFAGEAEIHTEPRGGSGSTDVGNVSMVCPTAFSHLGVGNTDGSGAHQEEFLPHCDGPEAYAALSRAVLAQTYFCAGIAADQDLQARLSECKQKLPHWQKTEQPQ